jgi:uncharacterized protein YkwD
LHFNLVDGLLVVLVAIAAVDGARRGFSTYATELMAFGAGLGVAFVLFAPLSTALHDALQVPQPLAGFGVFLIVLVIAHGGLQAILGRRVLWVGKHLGLDPGGVLGGAGAVPAMGTAVVLAALVLSALVVLPTASKPLVLSSTLGSTLTRESSFLQPPLEKLLVPANQQAQNLVIPNVPPDAGADAFYRLQFPDQLEVSLDVLAENRMLVLVNKVRQQNGLHTLQMDPILQEAAREHSLDMYQRHYFSHLTPDAKSPFDRMRALQARFVTAGENIAFAPDVDQAYESLLASPDHRANLLNPDFRCVGMGVYRATGYEEMFTQDFTDCGG